MQLAYHVFLTFGNETIWLHHIDVLLGIAIKELSGQPFSIFYNHNMFQWIEVLCDAPKPGGSLTTRQPVEYSWMSSYSTPLTKIGQSLICTGSSTQGTTCPNNQQ